jgi:hypothetical protein
MTYAVILTAHAVLDAEEICDYIAINDLPQKAEYVLMQMEGDRWKHYYKEEYLMLF